MSRREFIEITDPDDPRLLDLASKWTGLTRQDMGRELARFRAWPGSRLTAGFVVINAVLSVILLALPVEKPWALAVTLLVCSVPSYVIFALIGVPEKHRVCEYGMALGFRRDTKLVVPWETIDPGRVHVVENLNAIARQPDVGMAYTNRTGGLCTRGLVVNGLNSASWDPLYANWILATQHPERLAAEIEKAMLADGYPAEGLAANASRTAVRAPWRPTGPLLTRREPLDPVIGLPPQNP